MTQHTPGPWRLATDFAGEPGCCIIAPGGTVAQAVALIGNPAKGDWLANARLIAAAPELLAAMERLIAEAGTDSMEAWAQAHAAVKKARGEQP